MRKVISFLGTSVRETQYSYQGQVYTGGVFQIAMRQFLDFNEMLVFVTKDAREKAYPTLEALQDSRIRPIDIPDGTTADELWQLFSALVANVNESDQVIFDITHGLRSIPFLVFLAAAYLRSAKKVRLKKVLYGALELGKGCPAPVIDLSKFVDLLDWLTATDQFVKTGNALALAQLLSQPDRPALMDLAGTVSDISLGLRLLRPTETSLAAHRLPGHLSAAQAELPPPFTLLSDRLSSSYGRFALPPGADARSQLICQLQMIVWYHKRGQVVQTLSMAREWVISLLCYHFGLDAREKPNRDAMEFLIGGGKRKDADGNTIEESPYLDQWAAIPEGTRLRALWLKQPCQLREVRNDVLHSGFRKGTRPAQEILDTAKLIVDELLSIAQKWGLLGTEKEGD